MSNSSLVTYSNISPNKNSPRNHAIDTISIHCVVAQWTAKQIVDFLSNPSVEASCNYAVGKDGSIALGVDENDRSWCTSSWSNDNRAITIEVASDTYDPYAVTDEAYNALIKLVADICKRNGIAELKWKADPSLIGQVDKQNMTVHRWFANKACPGDYLFERHYDIANKVNQILNGNTPMPDPDPIPDPDPVPVDNMYRIRKDWNDPASQVGAYKNLENAKRAADAAGDEYYVFDKNGKVIYPENKVEFQLGEIVRLRENAVYSSGDSIPDWVIDSNLYIRELRDNTAVISTQSHGAITGVVEYKYLYKENDEITNEPYLVKVNAYYLNIRQGPGTNYPTNGSIQSGGIFTIVDISDGEGATKWGKLKSGAGWISLDYCEKV